MKKKILIQTINKEIYQKLNLLNIVPEVILKNTEIGDLNKIIKSINRKFNIVEAEILGNNMILVRKKNHEFDLNIYLR